MVDKEAEEEQYRDLTLLMELLTNLLSKDFIDLSPADSGESAEEVIGLMVTQVSLCFYHSGSDSCRCLPAWAEHHHASHVGRTAQIPQPVPSGLEKN